MEEVIKQIYEQAKQIGACSLFKGDEKTLDDIVRLFLTPQGIEFCIKNHFPNISTFRQFKPYSGEKYGIYIDAGVITLKNPKKVVLIGKTSATVNCDTCESHEVIFMHGAKGTVNSSKWAVVRVETGQGCNVIKNVFNNAIIL